MDEFLILLQAKLDEAKSKGNLNGSSGDIAKLQGQLDKLKVQIELDPKVTQKLAVDIGKLINQKIVISNIGIDTNSASKAGENYGKQFNQGLSQEIKNNSSKLETFKKSLANIGMGAKEIDTVANKINNLGVQIETLNQTRSIGKKDILSVNIAGIDQYGQAIKLTQQYNIATGELVNAIDAVSTAQQNIGNNTNSIKKAENVFADYTAKIEQFKSTNSNILSGLSDPLSDFENKLSGLKNGNTSIDEVINSYKNLNAEASKITSNLSAQFNKVDSAVRNIAKGDEAIASLRADFKGLSNAPKEVNSELSKCEKLLLNVKNIESQEGRTVNWSAAYKEWEQSLDSLKAKISTLKKEQSNVASTQVFNTKDLDSQGKIYIQKVNNTIEKTKSELESKLRNAGYVDIQIKGVEDASGKIKSLTANVTDATGAFKQLNFERAKIQGNGKAQAGFVQTDDVKVIGNISSAVDKVQNSLSSLKAKWEEQGVLIGEFKTKVDQLESSLSSVGSKNELNGLKAQIQELKNEASTISQIHEIQLSIGSNGDVYTQIDVLRNNFTKLGLSADEVSTKMNGVDKELNELKALLNNGGNNSAITTQFDKLQSVLKDTQNDLKSTRSEYSLLVSMQQRLSKANEIEAWNQKNSAATKDVRAANEAYIVSLRDLNSQMTKMQFGEISDGFKKNENSMRALSKLGASFKDQMSQAAQSFTQWLSVSSSVMLLISKTKDAISEIKELDNILTEISKTSDMTSQQLKQLGMDAYDAASKYGRTASDYLLGVQEMARSGFYGEKGTAMAEQSLLAQSAGDMTADLANNYILATNAAYKLNGEADKLNAVLDGQNSITNRNSVAMADMATAMSEAGTVASSYRVSIKDLSAMIGTIESVTKLGGSEVGNAIKAILINLQNVTSSKITDTLDAANASMTEFVNGTEKLRNPIDILRDLAKTFSQLDEDDPLRAEILTNIGQKYHAAKLGALLQNMEMFDKMLVDYSEGTGSALEESNKSAENLTGTLNKLHNSWTEFVNGIIESEGLKTGVKLLNGLVEGATSLTSKLGSLGTIGLGAGLFSSIKNVGGWRNVSPICYLF